MKANSGKFKLDENFLLPYRTRKANFGFNGLGEIVYKRSYARVKDNGVTEEWNETVERVVNGCFNMQRRHLEEIGMPFNYDVSQQEAQKMYSKIFEFKFLPPGRGLWAMGTKLTEEKHLFATLNNCAFVSTGYVNPEEFAKPFLFLMDLSMLGVGVGFDTKGTGKLVIKKPNADKPSIVVIDDSREGWVNSVKSLLRSYYVGTEVVEFDYSKIRPEGILLKGFGGISSGPGPLKELHNSIRKVLESLVGKPISSRAIVDMMNMIGKCIVSGNIRRTAEIALGEAEDDEFLNLKNYKQNPERESYGWTSNNSLFAKIGMDYTKACDSVRRNGEPGFCWLDNMKAYGRMCEPPNYKDQKAAGGNPCLEQTLETFEMCCLVETFPYNHSTYEEYEDTLSSAFLYSKTVTLGLSHWTETNEVIKKNRRIGCSMSGIAQFLSKYDLHTLKIWAEKGYKFIQSCDEKLSKHFQINCSVKTTCIKPSGTVSLLAGATPGVHFPESQYYIRRMRFSKNSDLYEPLVKSNYKIEQDAYSKDPQAMVVEIPVCVGTNIRTIKQVSMWEQLELAAFLQQYWADNQVSCTIQFDNETEGHLIAQALNFFQYKLKGVSFLPRLNAGTTIYKQLPYEEITEEKYNELIAGIKIFDSASSPRKNTAQQDPIAPNFCDGDKCVAPNLASLIS
jgi:adenosylcobalamin-dependent ribonucleoside-triphosphate reductase